MTKIIKKEMVVIDKVVGLQCDRCKKISYDEMETQEFISVSDTGGFLSAWGDGTTFSADLCSPCSLKVLGSFASIQENEYDDSNEMDELTELVSSEGTKED